jgi:hypothetical protein
MYTRYDKIGLLQNDVLSAASTRAIVKMQLSKMITSYSQLEEHYYYCPDLRC